MKCANPTRRRLQVPVTPAAVGPARYRWDHKPSRSQPPDNRKPPKLDGPVHFVGDGAEARTGPPPRHRASPSSAIGGPTPSPYRVPAGRQSLKRGSTRSGAGVAGVDWSLIAQAAWHLLAGMARQSRTLPANLARHASRARILDAVCHDPGKNLARICDELSLSRGTAAYHLYILERVGAVDSLARPHTRHYFPPQVEPALRPALAALRRERSLEVARAVLEQPGLEQRELLTRIGMDRKVWKAYREEFAREGLVVEERAGRRIRYRPTAKLRHLVDPIRLGGAPPEAAAEPAEAVR